MDDEIRRLARYANVMKVYDYILSHDGSEVYYPALAKVAGFDCFHCGRESCDLLNAAISRLSGSNLVRIGYYSVNGMFVETSPIERTASVLEIGTEGSRLFRSAYVPTRGVLRDEFALYRTALADALEDILKDGGRRI
jgi:hypothetical protein